jgi:LuxR family transcriptional regulator, maltose regulon positive regulatory protein
VLVLDDYHVIMAEPIHDAITYLLDHLPPRMHLVITTRADPPLPLSRLRARGQLVKLRAADLCFTPEEATVFLGAACYRVGRERVGQPGDGGDPSARP